MNIKKLSLGALTFGFLLGQTLNSNAVARNDTEVANVKSDTTVARIGNTDTTTTTLDTIAEKYSLKDLKRIEKQNEDLVIGFGNLINLLDMYTDGKGLALREIENQYGSLEKTVSELRRNKNLPDKTTENVSLYEKRKVEIKERYTKRAEEVVRACNPKNMNSQELIRAWILSTIHGDTASEIKKDDILDYRERLRLSRVFNKDNQYQTEIDAFENLIKKGSDYQREILFLIQKARELTVYGLDPVKTADYVFRDKRAYVESISSIQRELGNLSDFFKIEKDTWIAFIDDYNKKFSSMEGQYAKLSNDANKLIEEFQRRTKNNIHSEDSDTQIRLLKGIIENMYELSSLRTIELKRRSEEVISMFKASLEINLEKEVNKRIKDVEKLRSKGHYNDALSALNEIDKMQRERNVFFFNVDNGINEIEEEKTAYKDAISVLQLRNPGSEPIDYNGFASAYQLYKRINPQSKDHDAAYQEIKVAYDVVPSVLKLIEQKKLAEAYLTYNISWKKLKTYNIFDQKLEDARISLYEKIGSWIRELPEIIKNQKLMEDWDKLEQTKMQYEILKDYIRSNFDGFEISNEKWIKSSSNVVKK